MGRLNLKSQIPDSVDFFHHRIFSFKKYLFNEGIVPSFYTVQNTVGSNSVHSTRQNPFCSGTQLRERGESRGESTTSLSLAPTPNEVKPQPSDIQNVLPSALGNLLSGLSSHHSFQFSFIVILLSHLPPSIAVSIEKNW